jgi:malonyl CoA-acyl carrier protein transacylase
MNCFIFPGQPITFSEMPAHDTEFKKIAMLCQETTGFNPLETGTSASDLSESVRLQLFGTCISLYRFTQIINQGILPDLLAEHSMGIYPALAASGSVDNATALALTCRLGETMALLGVNMEYALGCVIGLARGLLETVAVNNDVYIVNYNTSRHFMLAGEMKKVEAATIEAKATGAFSVTVFPCDAPLHTPLIEEISGDVQRIVADYSFREPGVTLIEHINQTVLTAATIPAFLVDELCHPVYWEKTYRALCLRGVTRFQEVGAGASVSKFNRWIDSES